MTPRTPARARPGAANPAGASGPVDLTDWALAAGGAVLVVGGVLWAGAALACLLTGRSVPDGGVLPALRALGSFPDPGSVWPDPDAMPGPVAYWAATLLVLAAVAGLAVAAWRLRDRIGHGRDGAPDVRAIRTLPGLATPAEAARAAGTRPLLARAGVVRPSLAGATKTEPGQVGYRVGRAGGRDLWCSVEDSALLLGPPRMGKGLHVVIPWVLDAPGPVVATSTRPDTLAVTFHHRTTKGPVAIFDPQRLAGLPGRLRWSPVRGCETPRTALVRARGLAAGAGFGRGVSDSDFWAGQTEAALRCLLHAAALDGRRAVDVYRWSLNPVLAEDAVTILTPLPSLPALMAEGGGTGITTLAILQSLAQARHRWGEHAADAIWDAATVKLVLGGLGKYRDLDDVARLLGEIDELTQTHNRGRHGERSSSTSVRQVPVMPASLLRTLPFGTGVLLLRQSRPAVVDLNAWPDRPDATRLVTGKAAIEAATAATAAGVARPGMVGGAS